MCKDILSTMGNAFGFVTSKEVVVAPWFKKPDVDFFFNATGELLTIYLDVTLPALHQEAKEECPVWLARQRGHRTQP